MTRSSLLFLVLTYVTKLKAQEGFISTVGEFLGVEYYEYQENRYGIFTDKVTWEEASQMCTARNGSLVTYQEPTVAEFIARALAESAVGFGSLWVGGRMYKGDTDGNGVWKWTNNDKSEIKSIFPETEGYPMEASPFWVDKPPTEFADLCLGTDRRLHHLPLIVPVDCGQQRPYICDLPKAAHGGSHEEKPPIDVGGRMFHVFQAGVTWAEALSECREMGMKLAKVTHPDEFKKIGHKMLRIRPVMENAWIGGYFTNEKWTWTSTNEPININEDGTAEEPNIWYRPKNIIMEGCLLADRHVCDHFVYVEALCDRRRNFICERDVGVTILPPIVKVVDGWWISTITVTWTVAQQYCVDCLEGNLLMIEPADQATVMKTLPILYQGMAMTVGTEIRHIWLGGRLYGTTFKWATDENTEPGEEMAITSEKYNKLYGNGNFGILDYCNVSLEVDTYLLKYQCLNLDRENQKNFFMYGLTCAMKQHFMCRAKEETKELLKCKQIFGGPVWTPTTMPPEATRPKSG